MNITQPVCLFVALGIQYAMRLRHIVICTCTWGQNLLVTMYIIRHIELRSCNHCYSRKTMNITQPVCLFVALGMQYAMRLRHIVICDLSHSFFPHCVINGRIKKKKVTGYKMCFNFLHDVCLKYLSL